MLQLKHITQHDADLETARHLFKAYADELAVDLCFQSFDAELENPLKKYGLPSGSLLLAYWNNEPVGCIALTDITYAATSHAEAAEQSIERSVQTCEMKRLYVQPAFRKHKIGEALVDAILQQAQVLNYAVMKLDTLERLQAAIQLYLKKGFVITNAYYQNPLPGVVYMEKQLA